MSTKGKIEVDPVHEIQDSESKAIKHDHGGHIVLIPQPSDDPADPLNWPMSTKIPIFLVICFAGFAGQMTPNANLLTFTEQIPVYHTTQNDMLNAVAAGLAGWVAGPFIFPPLAGVIGRSAVILWSLVACFACQIWAANMTGADDYISYVLSRFVCGLFGGIPAILGAGYIIDMFFLHQRGKAFAVFEITIVFAVVGGGTLGAFVAQTLPWMDVFWWTLGPVGAAILLVLVFVQDTTYDRTPGATNATLPKPWLMNRIATFAPGTKTQQSKKGSELLRRVIIPFQITISPVSILVGSFVFIGLGLPVMMASTLAIYLIPSPEAGGYGFSSLEIAFFTMSYWVGIIAAQIFGYFFNDKIPLWVATRRNGVWHPEYRLANTILPGIILPIALGLYGAGLQYHLHYMVLAVASALVWFGAMLAMPVCYNYIVECFLQYPVEASVCLNAYRVSFGLISVFAVTQWQQAVGVGWLWGMGAFFVVAADIVMVWVIIKGRMVRKLTMHVSKSITTTEDGQHLSY